MKFLSGMLTALLLIGVLAAAVVLTGSYNTAASAPPGKLEKRLAELALDRAVARRAPKVPNPVGSSPEALRTGLTHYKEMCVVCHGGPGVEASEIGDGLNPPAPDLTLTRVQKRTDGELYWLVAHGIRMTGMPAFAPTHSDDELWKMVAFVRHLPELTPEEEEELRKAESAGHHEAEKERSEKKKGHTDPPGSKPHEH